MASERGIVFPGHKVSVPIARPLIVVKPERGCPMCIMEQQACRYHRIVFLNPLSPSRQEGEQTRCLAGGIQSQGSGRHVAPKQPRFIN